MRLFEWGRLLHSSAGVVALIAFWAAALAAKGGDVHRRAGRIYLVALLTVMACSTLMVAGRASQGDTGGAVFLGFLVSMVGTASWLMWFSVRYRRQPQRLIARLYRVLASWCIVMGGGMMALGIARGRPVMAFIPAIAVGFGVNMWRLALAPVPDARWWRAHHMNGAMLNFIATHDSFIALGIGSVVPGVRHGMARLLVTLTVTAIGVSARVWLGRRDASRRAAAVLQPTSVQTETG